MNKDLPIIIKKVFTDPDPIVWQGIWLSTLENLLKDPKMLKVWKELASMFKVKHDEGSNLQLNQYMKWELKAFVAQIVKLRIANESYKVFINTLDGYFQKKGMNLNSVLILEIYRVIDVIKKKCIFKD